MVFIFIASNDDDFITLGDRHAGTDSDWNNDS